MSTDLGTSLKAAGAMATLKNEEPTCPGIDFTYRLIAFLGQGILGILLVIAKIKFSPTINDSIALTIGIIILFTSVLWIMNYKNLFKKMLEPVRMVNAFILFGCMAASIIIPLVFPNINYIPFIVGIVECCACVWYLLSFIPFAQNLCTTISKSCCNACLKGENA